MQLYPHNQRAYNSAVEIFKKENKTCIIQPTGTGKAVIIAKFITDNPQAKHLLLAPGEHIAAEVRKHTEGADFIFRTYKSLLSEKTITALNNFDYIYLDEFHRVGAGEWGPKALRLLENNPQAKVLGTTATHIRFLDCGRDMAFELFRNNIASFISLNRAFLEGILYPPKYVSAIYSIAEEYQRAEKKIRDSNHKRKEILITQMKAKVIDWETSSGIDVILKKHLPSSRRKLIVFCNSIEEMKMSEEIVLPILKNVFGNVLSLHVHSGLTKKENSQLLACFHEDDDVTKVLFTVDMLNEGLHAKDNSTVILLRETGSPIIWYQQIGRCFSVGQKEQPIVIDLVNNFRNIQLNTFRMDYEKEKMSLMMTNLKDNLDPFVGKTKTVELIDETQRIQDILTSFSDQVDSWDIWYAKAKEFFDKNGHLTVPTKQDKKLLHWIFMQRIACRAGRLSVEKVALLSKIGIDWNNSDEERWHNKFLQLKTAIEAHGCLQPTHKSLYDWLTIQKRKYQQNKLKEEHKHLLEEVVSLENHRIVAWTNKLKRIEEYFAEHKKFLASNGNTIQKDVDMVRAAHKMGKMPQFVYDRLSEMGFVFDYKRNSFEKTLELVIKFIRESNGQLPTESTNRYLRQWFLKQCLKYRRGQLKKEHIDLFRMQESATGLKLLPTSIFTPAKQRRRA